MKKKKYEEKQNNGRLLFLALFSNSRLKQLINNAGSYAKWIKKLTN